MSMETDPVLYRDLADKDPDDVCRRALCRYDQETKTYRLDLWGDTWSVMPHENRIERLKAALPEPVEYLGIFIVNYLLQIQDTEPSGDWISEKDIPGGTTFFRGPHEIPTRMISSRFGEDIDGFKELCRKWGGKPADMGDAAFDFEITPRLPVRVLLWEGDEDFPAEAKILYDKTIMDHLTSDIVFALAVDICVRFKNA